MKKKTSRPLLTAGTSTLLLIFLSLCLLTFAVLSLLSARADRNLPEDCRPDHGLLVRPATRQRIELGKLMEF
ncbi:MAG: hypothetical protein ACLR2E_15000 [Lachnospiraceae bacterium]